MTELMHSNANIARVDAVLTPLALTVALTATEEPFALLAIGPLVWLMHSSPKTGASATAQPWSSTGPTAGR